ncbi:PepSY domain-containing protein [Streptomyces sp. NPDC004610]|uniref:PepSY domain-containing protein n=1 Tax=unclassified Streptomyces TaxID=2593676 RepID=UPI0033B131F5
MKRNIIIAAITATAVIGGGTTLAFAAGGDGSTSPSPSSSTSAASTVTLPPSDDDRENDDRRGAKITAAQAIETALKERPGTAVSADLDTEDDDRDDDADDDADDDDKGDDDGPAGLSWEIGILGTGDTSYTVYVDPATGRILDTRDGSDDDDSDEERAALRGVEVSALEAANAAAAKGFVTSVDLDDDADDRALNWDIEVSNASNGTESDWTVDTKSGTVTADRDDAGSDDAGSDDAGDDDGRDDDRNGDDDRSEG